MESCELVETDLIGGQDMVAKMVAWWCPSLALVNWFGAAQAGPGAMVSAATELAAVRVPGGSWL